MIEAEELTKLILAEFEAAKKNENLEKVQNEIAEKRDESEENYGFKLTEFAKELAELVKSEQSEENSGENPEISAQNDEKESEIPAEIPQESPNLAEIKSDEIPNLPEIPPIESVQFPAQILEKELEEAQEITDFKALFEKDRDEQIRFLNAVKERISVLFAGLSQFDSGDIEARVELSLKFIEFLLANIEKRLDALK